MRDFSAQPGFTQALLARLGNSGDRRGPALLTPGLADTLRRMILGKDWEGLDRFPGWDTRQLAASVGAVDAYVSRRSNTADHPATKFLDVAPYSLTARETISLTGPPDAPSLGSHPFFVQVAGPLASGAGPNALAPEHAESGRLAAALNRLAANQLDGVAPASVTFGGKQASSPEQLVALLQPAGEQVSVNDTRYFANFAQLVYGGKDVIAPFWVDTHIPIPHSGGLFHPDRSLLVPVSHAELEMHVHPQTGKKGLDADVSYYFGIDGKSEWRTMDTADQAWVLKRNAHFYSGQQAVEVARLAHLLTLAYMHQHETRPLLPFGGYYILGVCQDGVAAVELHMTGRVTLFPDTADARYFDDPRDAEINGILQRTPKDRDGKAPTLERVFGALPTADFAAITIPGLGDDLTRVRNGQHRLP